MNSLQSLRCRQSPKAHCDEVYAMTSRSQSCCDSVHDLGAAAA
jgi:hypothetical protein